MSIPYDADLIIIENKETRLNSLATPYIFSLVLDVLNIF
jgi:hypothetical protein